MIFNLWIRPGFIFELFQ